MQTCRILPLDEMLLPHDGRRDPQEIHVREPARDVDHLTLEDELDVAAIALGLTVGVDGRILRYLEAGLATDGDELRLTVRLSRLLGYLFPEEAGLQVGGG